MNDETTEMIQGINPLTDREREVLIHDHRPDEGGVLCAACRNPHPCKVRRLAAQSQNQDTFIKELSEMVGKRQDQAYYLDRARQALLEIESLATAHTGHWHWATGALLKAAGILARDALRLSDLAAGVGTLTPVSRLAEARGVDPAYEAVRAQAEDSQATSTPRS